MANATDAELVRGQLHPNDWVVRQARRVLQERAAGGRDLAYARRLLFEILDGSETVQHKLRALWSLNSIGALDDARLIELLKHQDDHLRAWGVRLLADRLELSPSAVAALQQLAARETSGLVQVYLASTMQRLQTADRWPIAAALSSRDEFANDRELPLMIWYGIEPAVVQQPAQAVELVYSSKIPQVRQNVARRLTGELDRLPDVVNELTRRLGESHDPAQQIDVLTGMSLGLRGWRKAPAPAVWSATAEKLAASTENKVQTLARDLSVVFGDGRALDELRQIVGDGNADPDARVQALRTIVDSRPDDLATLLVKLL